MSKDIILTNAIPSNTDKNLFFADIFGKAANLFKINSWNSFKKSADYLSTVATPISVKETQSGFEIIYQADNAPLGARKNGTRVDYTALQFEGKKDLEEALSALNNPESYATFLSAPKPYIPFARPDAQTTLVEIERQFGPALLGYYTLDNTTKGHENLFINGDGDKIVYARKEGNQVAYFYENPYLNPNAQPFRFAFRNGPHLVQFKDEKGFVSPYSVDMPIYKCFPPQINNEVVNETSFIEAFNQKESLLVAKQK